jgi:biofilm PGA synthesis N-glycosyltransferase PgaC
MIVYFWIIFLIILTLAVVYALILYTILSHISRSPKVSLQTEKIILPVSVVIAARNEANHITACLTSLVQQCKGGVNHEIIVVDDHSSDNTREIIMSFQHEIVRYFLLPKGIEGKKQALTYGIQQAKHEIIAVTDADCSTGPGWVNSISATYQAHATLAMTTGYVIPEMSDHVLSSFQTLDFSATMVFTRYGIEKELFYLANGANMSFAKSAFLQVSGFMGNEHIASGDDVFLVRKLSELPGQKIKFIADARCMVTTEAEKSWQQLWTQRKRWATKTRAYASRHVFLFQSLVFSLAISIPAALLAGLFIHPAFYIIAGCTALAKGITDFIFLQNTTALLRQKNAMRHFLPSFILYQLYIIAMGFTVIFPSKTQWKNREV